jgi:NAD+ synthetase
MVKHKNMSNLKYEKVFNILVDETEKYLKEHSIQAMVLGISGGIDSTVTAAICSEVSKRTGISLIGRSLPINNKDDEFNTSKLVGEAFCNDFKVLKIGGLYWNTLSDLCEDVGDISAGDFSTIRCLEEMPSRTPIANGNLQARLRMIYLYDLASRNKGIVISTDNQTEYQLGFWTLHGDVGDFNPLFGLWKTEVYALAKWLEVMYGTRAEEVEDEDFTQLCKRESAIHESIKLTPTDGLGISNSDLEQIGAKSYQEVDDILQEFEAFQYLYPKRLAGMTLKERAKEFLDNQEMLYIEPEVIIKVIDKHVKSEFKRKNLPICITRDKYEYREENNH